MGRLKSLMRGVSRRTVVVMGAVVAVVAGACTESVAPTPIASLLCTPIGGDSVEVGSQTTNLSFRALDQVGRELAGIKFTFTSSATDVATVDANGVATGVKFGQASITATAQSRSCQVNLKVIQKVASVVVSPSPNDVPLGTTKQLTATIFDAQGTAVPGRVVTWSTANAAIAVVNTLGVVTPIAVGTTTITAAVGTKTATATVVVKPEPVQRVVMTSHPQGGVVILRVSNTLQLTAAAYGSGPALTDRTINWTTSNPTVATVSNNGLVTALAVGTVVITAESEQKIASLTVQITLVPVVTASIVPTTLSILQGTNQQLTAVAKDSAGNTLSLTGRVVFWSTSDNTIASVGGTGVLSAFAAGSAAIRVQIDTAQSAPLNVTVTAPVVVSVQVTPNTNTIKVGLTSLLSAIARDINQNVINGKVFTWSTSDAACATVTPNGLVQAVAVGNCTITAAVDGKSGTAQVTVIP